MLFGLLLVLGHTVISYSSTPFVENDNFCDDIRKGSDEKNSSACTFLPNLNMKFTCENELDKHLPLSRVGDGVCDCCNGSDEAPGFCQDKCEAQKMKAEAGWSLPAIPTMIAELGFEEDPLRKPFIDMAYDEGYTINNFETWESNSLNSLKRLMIFSRCIEDEEVLRIQIRYMMKKTIFEIKTDDGLESSFNNLVE